MGHRHGGGSIRYPAALTGLFGIKPQRDRISLGPDHHDAWNGLTAYGPLARTVRDAALFLECTAANLPEGGFIRALDTTTTPLRVAVSFKPPRGSLSRLGAEHRTAVELTAELLRSLGHDVFEQEVDYGLVLGNVTVRYLEGVHHDVATMARPERLEPTTRRAASLGGHVSARRLRSARAQERAFADRINRSFERADVVLTPMVGGSPPAIADVAGRGLTRSLLRSNVSAWATPWNAIGQPAASVPAGFDAQGLPLAVQLCGRVDDEATILRVAAQLERSRPWAHDRPATDR